MNNVEIDAYRAKEMDKALLLSKLFKSEYYAPIKQILDDLGKKELTELVAEEKFMKIYNNAQIKADKSEGQIYPKWLWNYLKHYDPKLSATW